MPAFQKARREWSNPNGLSAIQWNVPPIFLEYGDAYFQVRIFEPETVDQHTELLETCQMTDLTALTNDDGASPVVQTALWPSHLPPSWLLRVYSKFCAAND